MSLEADQLIDRRRLKRRLAFWRIVGVVAVVAAVAVAAGRLLPWATGDYVARLVVEGIVLDDPKREQVLRSIAEDDGAQSLIVYLDTPGGSVVGGESLYLSLRKVAVRKPVVAVMGDLATSAGYMTALGADRIFARAGSLTGSVGVIMQTANITGLLEKLGIKPETVKSAPLKAQPNPMEPFTEEAREATRQVVLDVFDMFVDMVSERRSLPRDRVLVLADGRVFTGRQALDVGLIDEIGGEAEARRWLADAHGIAETVPAHTVEIRHDDGIWREFLGTMLGKTVFSERLRLDGLVSLWHPEAW